MIIFNITTLADENIHGEWKDWILDELFPSIEHADIFKSRSLLKVLDSPNEGVTYSLQFLADNKEVIEKFRSNKLYAALHDKIQQDYPNKIFLFESLLEYQ